MSRPGGEDVPQPDESESRTCLGEHERSVRTVRKGAPYRM
jgi:hypothetical protein